jgi:hypothetical protein
LVSRYTLQALSRFSFLGTRSGFSLLPAFAGRQVGAVSSNKSFLSFYYVIGKVCSNDERIIIVFAKGEYLQTLKNNP